jgi:hypothetical protein
MRLFGLQSGREDALRRGVAGRDGMRRVRVSVLWARIRLVDATSLVVS